MGGRGRTLPAAYFQTMSNKQPKKQVSKRLSPITPEKAPQSLSLFAEGGGVIESNQYQSLALRSMFWKPDYLNPSGSAWVEHLPFAFWVVEALRPGLFVELGTYNGHSYFSFCQAIKCLGLNTPSYAVDTWIGDEHAGRIGEDVFQQVSYYNQSHYREFSSLLRCTFDDAVSRFADGTVDLLHIDGFHTYEVVRHDFETWLPKLSDRAVVLFHDTNVREGSFGVHKFFSQISKTYPHFEFIHGHGLGVLGVGASQPKMLSTLFDCYAHQPSRNIVYELFSRLGSYCHDGLDLNTEKRNSSAQSGRIAELERIAQDSAERIAQLEQLGVERALEIERLSAEKQALEGRSAEGEAQSAARISLLEQLGGEKALEIERLNAEVAKVNAERQALEGRIAEGEAQSAARISLLEQLGGEKALEIERLNAEVAKVNAERQALEGRIAEGEAQSAARISQLEQLGVERALEIERLNAELAKLTGMLVDAQIDRDRWASENSELAARFEDFKTQTAAAEAQSTARIARLEQEGTTSATEIERLNGELQNAKTNIQERFEELAKLTRMFIDAKENGKKLAAAWRQQSTPTVFGEATSVGKAEGGEFQHIEYTLKDIQHLGRQFRGIQARIINHRGDVGIVIFEPDPQERAFYGWERTGEENGRNYMLIIPKHKAGREKLFAATTNDLLLIKAIVLEIAVHLAQTDEQKNAFWQKNCDRILEEFEALPTRLHYDDVKTTSKQGKCAEVKIINPSWRNRLIFQDTIALSGQKIMAIKDQKGHDMPKLKHASNCQKEIFNAYQKEITNLLFHVNK